MKSISVILAIFLMIPACGPKNADKTANELYNMMQKKLKDEERQIKTIDTEGKFRTFVNVCLGDREDHINDYPGLGSEENQFLIPFLGAKRKDFGDKTTAELLLLLDQDGGAIDSEIMDNFYREILYENPKAAVEAMADTLKDTVFKKQALIKIWYGRGCGVPTNLAQDPDLKQKKEALKVKLKELMNKENVDFINYLFDHKCLDN